MISPAWPFAVATALIALSALLVHTRVLGFLPEDPPGPGRKRHPRPTPMLGSIPAAVAITACSLSGAHALALSIAVAGATGLIDDLRKASGHDGLDWRLKAIGHLLATALALGALGLCADDPFRLLLVGSVVFGLINAFNFLDNQDGVSTALGACALWAAACRDQDPLAACLAAAWLAFLPFNWPTARAFLGDGGAYALGVCAAVTALRPLCTGTTALIPALAPVAVPVIDFVQVVTVRLVLGYAPWKGDRRHLTHLLLLLGVPRPALAVLLTLLALAIVLLAR